MKKYLISLSAISFILLLSLPTFKSMAQNGDNSSYIKEQKETFNYIIEKLNANSLDDAERDPDFDPCPMQELNDDFLGFNFKSIHSEQAGILDCDGPTFLNIYKNGLYINHTGTIEYQCYLNNFNLKYSGLQSGTLKSSIIESFGLPIIQSELVYFYGCTLDVDPFAGIEEDTEPVEVDENDPNNWILNFMFIFDEDKLEAIVYIIEHLCY